MTSKPLTYADAGVDLSAWHETKSRIGKLVKSTYNIGVLGGFGQFGGLFDVSFLKDYARPILVSSVDGVGTKLKIAFDTGIHNTVGEDIVNHCINDILVMGAKPLFFLDYLGTGRLAPDVAEHIVEGLAKACREADVVLIGGETAEMPGFYQVGEYDIAGTIVGVVDKPAVVDGSKIVPGDVIVGLRSNGLHTNGYSLARKITTEIAGNAYGDTFEPTGRTIGEELLRPHRSYRPVLKFMSEGVIKGCVHITGGGFQENIDRVLPSTCDAVIDTVAWKPDAIFSYLQENGKVENNEMYRTFNMGIGMTLIVAETDCEKVLQSDVLSAYEPCKIGAIEEGSGVVRMNF